MAKFGTLAKGTTTAGDGTLAYTVGANLRAGADVGIHNHTLGTATISVAVLESGATEPSDEDFIERDLDLSTQDFLSLSGLKLGSGESVYILSSVDGVNFRIQGEEK